MPARTPHTVTQPARSDSRCAALSASSPQPSHTPTASMIATAIRPALQRSACKTARNPRCGRWPRRSAAQSAARAIARDRPATAHWPAMTARRPQPCRAAAGHDRAPSQPGRGVGPGQPAWRPTPAPRAGGRTPRLRRRPGAPVSASPRRTRSAAPDTARPWWGATPAAPTTTPPRLHRHPGPPGEQHPHRKPLDPLRQVGGCGAMIGTMGSAVGAGAVAGGATGPGAGAVVSRPGWSGG